MRLVADFIRFKIWRSPGHGTMARPSEEGTPWLPGPRSSLTSTWSGSASGAPLSRPAKAAKAFDEAPAMQRGQVSGAHAEVAQTLHSPGMAWHNVPDAVKAGAWHMARGELGPAGDDLQQAWTVLSKQPPDDLRRHKALERLAALEDARGNPVEAARHRAPPAETKP